MSASHQHETWSELAVRENDGLVVSLFWSKATNRVQISVVDEKFDAELRIDVAGAMRARCVLPPVRVRGRRPRLRLCERRDLDLEPS